MLPDGKGQWEWNNLFLLQWDIFLISFQREVEEETLFVSEKSNDPLQSVEVREYQYRHCDRKVEQEWSTCGSREIAYSFHCVYC